MMANGRDFATQPGVSLDASKLLGFSGLARIFAAGETISVAELGELMRRSAAALPRDRLALGRLLSKIGEPVT